MLPEKFLDRLQRIIPQEHLNNVKDSFNAPRALTIRINTLKVKGDDVKCTLKDNNIHFNGVSWCKDVLILDEKKRNEFRELNIVSDGGVYQQALSSAWVSLVLNPKPNERVLDLCAAPGSKTSHMAALMENTGGICAIEVVKSRMYKLKSVLSLLGVTNTTLTFMDGRRFKAEEGLFDHVLVDAPCSSEGRFHLTQKKSYQYWSIRKIREMRKKQRGLLLTGLRALKPGGTLVYSTCTFAPEENEGVIDWALRKAKDVTLESIYVDESIASYPCLTSWEEKTFNPEVKKCVRILPTELVDGFFVAKFKKNI